MTSNALTIVCFLLIKIEFQSVVIFQVSRINLNIKYQEFQHEILILNKRFFAIFCYVDNFKLMIDHIARGKFASWIFAPCI